MLLLGFSVLGSPVFVTLDSSGEIIREKLEKEWKKVKKDKGNATQRTWKERFMDSGDELEHVAFLVLWLSYFVFPSRYYHIYGAILPIAVHLSSGTRIALAPAVLAHLYGELSLLKDHIKAFKESTLTAQTDLTALFKLVQVWTWERFKELQPKPNPLLKSEPRLALWHDLKQETSHAREILDNSKIDSFEWRPYSITVQNWEFPQFYPDKEMWVPVCSSLDDVFISFARCIKVSELVGIGKVEQYFPNRVSSQFGMLQDVPCPANQKSLSQEAAWNEYNKPIDDLTLYIPSRRALPCVTPMFCEWWKKSLTGFKFSSKEIVVVESAETFKERTLIGDDNSFTTSGSMTNRTSEDGMKKYEDSINKRPKYMKRARENDEITMGCCHTQVPLDNDEVDGRLTIAQMVGPSKKKYSDVKNGGRDTSEPLGKKCRVEVDNNDSGPCQKLASTSYDGNETVPPSEIEKKNEATDETGSKAGKNVVSPPETRKTCDGELDASKSNADMINDGSKQPKCLLHEDGIIAGEKASSDEKLCGSEAAKEDDIVDDDIMINNNEPVSHQQHASGGTKGDETSRAYESVVLSPSDESNIHIAVAEGSQGHEQRCEENGEEEAGSKGGNNTVLSPFDENNFSDPPFGANDTVVSPRETRKTCHDELNVYESNEDIINDGSKEPDCLLHEDGSIAGEKTSSDENFCSSEAEKQEESNIHITVAVGEGNQGQGCLLHDNVLESDETLKSNEVNEKRNKDFGEGDDCNDSYGKKFQELKVEALSIKERILKAQETVTWLKKRRATKQREIAVARLV
ncbi:unnamed protein product [Arabidopsis thaliana]|nr:unnamed protein product [Arabidopsis thaliana]